MKTELEKLQKELKRVTRQNATLAGLLDRVKLAADANKNVMEALQREREKQDTYMQLLLAYATEIILVFDGDAKLVYGTHKFLKYVNVDRIAKLQGLAYNEIFELFLGRDNAVDANSFFVQCLQKGVSINLKKAILHDGQFVHFAVNFSPLRGDGGQGMGAVVTFLDMTDLIKAKEEAERASFAKSTFLSNMGQEMRHPLNSIMNMMTLGTEANTLEKKDLCFNRIGQASNHLQGIINDVLDMSKIEANNFDLSLEEFNLEELLMRVVSVVNYAVDRKKQNLVLSIDNIIPYKIVSDEQRIAQVITYFLSNAVKHSPEHGSITLVAKCDNLTEGLCKVEISITDSGKGMSEEQKNLMFQPYPKMGNGEGNGQRGSGLGSVISKRIIEMLGGNITMTPGTPKGTNFTFSFPVQKGSLIVSNLLQAKSTNLRVLVIDPVELSRNSLKIMVENLGIYCDAAANGEEALRLVMRNQNTPYTLFFMDTVLPDMEADYFLQAVSRFMPVPSVVGLVSQGGQNGVARAITSRITSTVVKPVLPGQTHLVFAKK